MCSILTSVQRFSIAPEFFAFLVHLNVSSPFSNVGFLITVSMIRCPVVLHFARAKKHVSTSQSARFTLETSKICVVFTLHRSFYPTTPVHPVSVQNFEKTRGKKRRYTRKNMSVALRAVGAGRVTGQANAAARRYDRWKHKCIVHHIDRHTPLAKLALNTQLVDLTRRTTFEMIL